MMLATNIVMSKTLDRKAKLAFEWLESAYMVKVDDVLKFKFYFSEAINTKTSSVN